MLQDLPDQAIHEHGESGKRTHGQCALHARFGSCRGAAVVRGLAFTDPGATRSRAVEADVSFGFRVLDGSPARPSRF
jgi:hypothetical protein